MGSIGGRSPAPALSSSSRTTSSVATARPSGEVHMRSKRTPRPASQRPAARACSTPSAVSGESQRPWTRFCRLYSVCP